MKLSNFVLTPTKDYEFFAEVSVTTGALWWKRTERHKIRNPGSGSWHFVDTGEKLHEIPNFTVKQLFRAYLAQKSLSEAKAVAGRAQGPLA